MKALLEPIKEIARFDELFRDLKKGTAGVTVISGCLESQKAHMIAGLSEDAPVRLLIAENELKAKELYEDYRLYDAETLYYPAKDLIFYQADIHGNLLIRQRLQVIQALLERKEVTIITSVGGCMDFLLPLGVFEKHCIHLRNDSELDLDKIRKELVRLGYESTFQVESTGQFSVRGGILDIYPLTEQNPIRIELWGDEIDSIRSFDAESQRSIENLEEITIYPASELILTEDTIARGVKAIKKEAKAQSTKFRDKMMTEEAARIRRAAEEICDRIGEGEILQGAEQYLHYFYPETVSFLEYLPENSRIFLDEPNRIIECADALEAEFQESVSHRLEKGYLLPGQAKLMCSTAELVAKLNRRGCVAVSLMEPQKGEWNIRDEFSVTVKSVNSYNNQFPLLVKDLKSWKKAGYRIVLASPSRTRAQHLAEDLQNEEIPAFYSENEKRVLKPGEVMLIHGAARRGFEYPMQKFVLITETDIFGKEKKKNRKKSEYSGQKIQNFADLSIGDYVVHESHGLGIYRGIEKIEMDRVTRDYMKIEYAGGSNLYVLATQLDTLQKYASGEAAKVPKLNKIGGQEWNKTKSKVRGAVKNIAKELVELYAVRQEKEGYVCGPDTVWQREFEEMFPYEETDDQLRCIAEIKDDMQSDRPMDRLLCGDVGVGKTEVALRAAFKCVMGGKQCAILAPTTLLAWQHYNTILSRMEAFPVKVEMMSRFRTAKQQKETLRGLQSGSVDIVVGTHRLLSKDVKFHDLGLVIIDEEQRFGVKHKEKLKENFIGVDMLTLSATPIPRTLNMAMSGIRDLSTIEQPPIERQPVETFVLEYNDVILAEAMKKELARGGQVYYLHNRVDNIEACAAHVSKLVPGARIGIAHGKMTEEQISSVWQQLLDNEIDILVCTTLIETGVDVRNCNTLIIENADRMGLSQLYQIRGRVGRSSRKAYAYFTFTRDKVLTEIAAKRLSAIREFTSFGSGFRIAMRDLQIRGAGSLLGHSQHGHMEAVGYDLYVKMLGQAIAAARGEAPAPDKSDCLVDITVDAFLPEEYIPDAAGRIEAYKRIAAIETTSDAEDVLDELIDRYGSPPKSVQGLVDVSLVRVTAARVGIAEIVQRGDQLILYSDIVGPKQLGEVMEKFPHRVLYNALGRPYFSLRVQKGESPLVLLRDVVTLLPGAQNQPQTKP